MTYSEPNVTPESGAICYALSRRVVARNSLLAVLVGCLLTLTNQLDVLLTQAFSFRMAMKVFFNFLIPFVVSSASAALNRNTSVGR